MIGGASGGTCTAAFTTLEGRINHDSWSYYYTTSAAITQAVYLGAKLAEHTDLSRRNLNDAIKR